MKIIKIHKNHKNKAVYFHSFTNGINFCDFLLIFEYPKALQRGLLLKERICSSVSKFFPSRVDTHRKGRQKRKWWSYFPCKCKNVKSVKHNCNDCLSLLSEDQSEHEKEVNQQITDLDNKIADLESENEALKEERTILRERVRVGYLFSSCFYILFKI